MTAEHMQFYKYYELSIYGKDNWYTTHFTSFWNLWKCLFKKFLRSQDVQSNSPLQILWNILISYPLRYFNFNIQWSKVTFSMHLRRVLIFLTHQPIPIALSSDHWGSPLWIAGIILISSSSASEWKAQAKWQVDTPKLEIQNNNLQNYIQK